MQEVSLHAVAEDGEVERAEVVLPDVTVTSLKIDLPRPSESHDPFAAIPQ